MAQDDKWKQALAGTLSTGAHRVTGVEEREKVPEKVVGCVRISLRLLLRRMAGGRAGYLKQVRISA